MSNEYPTSSGSNNHTKETVEPNTNSGENLELYIKDDKAEIELLESTNNCKTFNKDQRFEAAHDERIAKINFHCSSCDMEEMVHYFGLEPTFVYGIKFNEPTYIMRDPFQPPPPGRKTKAEYFIALGSHCKLCDKTICKASECSFFYINSYCFSCIGKVSTQFPSDIQQKLRKQLTFV